jgi:hypothetical protein
VRSRVPGYLAAGTVGLLALAGGCSTEGFNGTVACRGTATEVGYDPADGVEVRMRGSRLGWADADGRGLDDEQCERVETQTGWFVGIRYRRTAEPVTLRCRLPGRFFLHANPSFSSESGEVFPDGSALYLVVERRRTIVVSAGLDDNPRNSSLTYSPRYCVPR